MWFVTVSPFFHTQVPFQSWRRECEQKIQAIMNVVCVAKQTVQIGTKSETQTNILTAKVHLTFTRWPSFCPWKAKTKRTIEKPLNRSLICMSTMQSNWWRHKRNHLFRFSQIVKWVLFKTYLFIVSIHNLREFS